MTLREAVLMTADRLKAVSDAPRDEAKLLAARAIGAERIGFLELENTVSKDALNKLTELVSRRLKREPLQYILGEQYFMGLRFLAEPCALIPRQDTETLCEEAVRLIRGRGYRTMLDICTGTGCIAVSVSKLTDIDAEASDISPDCAALAKRNAELNGVRLKTRAADLFDGAGRYDIITANPPYISDTDMLSLQEEVKREPDLALRGGRDGLSFYRRIAAEFMPHINTGGALLLEVGMGEARPVAELFRGLETDIVKDLNGIDRVVIVYFR